MKKLYTYIIIVFSLIFFSRCENKSVNVKIKLKDKIDTLIIDENTLFDDEKGISNLDKHYSVKGKYLPKMKHIYLELTYKGQLKSVIKHSEIFLNPLSNKVEIKKINNQKFDIYIKDEYLDTNIYFNFLISPQKNYVISSVYSKSLTFSNQLLGLAQFGKFVNQKNRN